MHCVKKVTDDLYWIGGSDRRLALFENVYPIPRGVSYNSYVLLDEKTVLLDTVDASISGLFFENLEYVLNGRTLDYLIVNHMEPDHCAVIGDVVRRYPDVKLVCNAKTVPMLKQFFNFPVEDRTVIVKEMDTLCTGKHTFAFVMAPMVHWPEAMVSYDTVDKILFSADAFGKFGANDIEDPEGWACEARRYYFGIVGKFGKNVQAVLQKVAAFDVERICPLHGPVLSENLAYYVETYTTWAHYEPENSGVTIAYASVYGHTKQAAEELARALEEKGQTVSLFDLARDDMAEAVEDAFRYDRLVLASITYAGDIFPFMTTFIHTLAEHAYQNRKVAFIESGTWAPVAAKAMRAQMEQLAGIEFAETVVTVRGSVDDAARAQIAALANELVS